MLIDPEFATIMRYVVKGRDRNGDERILTHTQTHKEAAEIKAGFQQTRGGELAQI